MMSRGHTCEHKSTDDTHEAEERRSGSTFKEYCKHVPKKGNQKGLVVSVPYQYES